MTDDELKEKPAEVNETKEEAPAKKKKHIVIPTVSRVDASKIGKSPEPQRVYCPVDHRAEFTHQVSPHRVVPLMSMQIPADEPEKPLLKFNPPPDAPKGRMPGFAKMPGRMPRTRLI
jgi:hypothetical protein